MSRLTVQDIDKQIQDDMDRFNDSIYDDMLPLLFLDYFKKAVMVIPPAAHKCGLGFIKEIINKRPDEISVLEIGVIINFIYGCPFKELYENVEEAVDTTIAFDEFRARYNQKVSDLQDSLNRKKKKLLEIGGFLKAAKMVDGTKGGLQVVEH